MSSLSFLFVVALYGISFHNSLSSSSSIQMNSIIYFLFDVSCFLTFFICVDVVNSARTSRRLFAVISVHIFCFLNIFHEKKRSRSILLLCRAFFELSFIYWIHEEQFYFIDYFRRAFFVH